MLNGIFPEADVSVTVCWPRAVIWLSWARGRRRWRSASCCAWASGSWFDPEASASCCQEAARSSGLAGPAPPRSGGAGRPWSGTRRCRRWWRGSGRGSPRGWPPGRMSRWRSVVVPLVVVRSLAEEGSTAAVKSRDRGGLDQRGGVAPGGRRRQRGQQGRQQGLVASGVGGEVDGQAPPTGLAGLADAGLAARSGRARPGPARPGT